MEQTAILPSDMDTVQIITEVSEKKRENKIRTRARLFCDEFALGFPRQRKQLSGRSHVPVVRFTRPVTASTADSLVSGRTTAALLVPACLALGEQKCVCAVQLAGSSFQPLMMCFHVRSSWMLGLLSSDQTNQ
jgi:hypothetical protein